MASQLRKVYNRFLAMHPRRQDIGLQRIQDLPKGYRITSND